MIKGWWSGLRGKGDYLENRKPCVQTPVLPKKKKKRHAHI
jgi:hypothetical protein